MLTVSKKSALAEAENSALTSSKLHRLTGNFDLCPILGILAYTAIVQKYASREQKSLAQNFAVGRAKTVGPGPISIKLVSTKKKTKHRNRLANIPQSLHSYNWWSKHLLLRKEFV